MLLSVFTLLLYSIVVVSDNNGRDPTCAFDREFDFSRTCSNPPTDYYCTLETKEQNWLHDLYQEAINEASNRPRKRREIRTLSDAERTAFYNALNQLKKDTSMTPNKYDVFASIHTNLTLCSVHKGSNFLGWHRIYILLLETALRQKDKSVVIPYWDWLIDNNNAMPKDTLMFTETFLGNGIGHVTTGPFKDWNDMYGCHLERDIGNNNKPLPSHEVIDMIEHNSTWINEEQVTDGGSSFKHEHYFTIEGQHNILHDWVGKMMLVLDSAPKDPVFFLHHTYIDYIWEKFRQKQISMNINPENDYPAIADEAYNTTKLHAPNRTMDCFFWLTNYQGYWNNFTEKLYAYEDSPTCPDCGHSEFLTCNQEIQRCIWKASGSSSFSLVWAILGTFFGVIGLVCIIAVVIWAKKEQICKRGKYMPF